MYGKKLLQDAPLDAWLINFNGMSTRQGLFYALRLENYVHCMFIFTFFV